jgi:4-amino-4-deoxy-L-arabinose transferase-like glycosyltransferase
VVVAALNVWWVHEHRHLGAYNVDEVGYMATGLRYHRSLDLLRPWEFLKTVGAPSSTGPLVPLLTVPFLLVFGRGVPVLMLVQPLIGLVAAIAVAGIATALADRRSGLVAGLVALGLPAMIQSARGFQYASAAGACLCLALWALLRSERGYSRWHMIGFGFSVGLMLLARTMAVGFLPGLAVATVMIVAHDRRAWSNVGLAAGATLVTAAPWWIASRDALYDYLFGFGYGRISQYYGDAGVADRISTRWRNLGDDLRALRWVGLAILVAVLAVVVIGRLAARRAVAEGDAEHHPSSTIDGRRVAAAAAVVIVGYFTLLTTRNQGVWFELPLELVLVALVVASTVKLGRAGRVAGVAAVSVAIAAVAISLTDSGGDLPLDMSQRSIHQSLQASLYGGLIDRERPLADADAALLANDDEQRAAAADRWWRANIEVANTIERYRRAADGLVFVSVSGNSHLINGQSILLTQELRSLPPAPSEVPDTAASSKELSEHLTPTWHGTHQRVLVMIRSRSLPFPEDREVPRFLKLAETEGWRHDARVDLPDGGDVLFLRFPNP